MTRRRTFAAPDHTDPAPDGAPEAPPTVNIGQSEFLEHLEKITALKQVMDDARTDLANAYKVFEEAGGDRKMLKLILRFRRQDAAKTRSEARHFQQYFTWVVGEQLELFEQDEAA